MSPAQGPLRPDPRRQAQPAIRGYAYQIWHSLLAWLTLKDGQVLVLEGAEDFDVIDDATATTVQVKDMRKRVSLRSRTIADALANFLDTVKRNPGREVRYRLLTTAVVTAEKGSPFGKGVAGLRLWEETQRTRDLEAAQSIATFLAKGEIRDALRAFLRRASASAVLSDLIQPVSWDTGSRDLSFVERAVTDSLIAHGANEGIPPSASRKVAGRLLRETLKFLTEPNRPPLTRSQFAEVFEEETSERVTHGELRILRRAMALAPNIAFDQEAGGTAAFSVATIERVQRTVPDLVFHPLPRPRLVNSLREILASHGSLTLLGSTGTGKTLLAREIALQTDASVVWTSFVDCEENDLPLLLRQIRLAKRETGGLGIFILDDVNFRGQRLSLERVAALLCEILYEGHHAVVTTARPIPAGIARRLGRLAPREERVPLFVASDIQSFALMHGCPQAAASVWSEVILAGTAGHPQLVHAVVEGLSRREWPEPGPDDLFAEPRDLHRERSEARQILAQHLPPAEREFVYALSLYGHRFRRDQALALGVLVGIDLPSPGDSLDLLLGPWIEPVSRDYLRLSPLLTNAASAAWPTDKVERMRSRIAEAVLRTGHLTLLEANSLLLHAIAGRSDSLLARLCGSLLSLPGDAEGKVAEAITWLAAVDLAPTADPPWNPGTLMVLRVLQYRIAASARPELCPRILDRWEKEAASIPDQELAALHRIALAEEVITRYEARTLPSIALRSLILLDSYRDQGPKAIRELVAEMGSSVFAGTPLAAMPFLVSGFFFVVHHCRDAHSVIDLLVSLSDLSEELRRKILALYINNPVGNALFVSQSWAGEIGKDAPDWGLARRALFKAVRYGRRWHAPPIAVAGYTGLAAVSAEHLDDRTGALRALDRAEGHLGALPRLRHQRAVVHFIFDEFQQALDIWEEFLREWKVQYSGYVDDGVAPTLGFRMAGIAAAKLGNWRSAAGWFEEGARRAATTMASHFVAGFEGDCAYCHWRTRDYDGFVSASMRALMALESRGENDVDLAARVTEKLVGHILLWAHTVNRSGDLSPVGEPWVGMCSNPNVNEEVAALSPTPLDLSWLHLCELEDEHLGSSRAYAAASARLQATAYPSLKHRVAHLALTKAVRIGDLAEVPRHAQAMADGVELLPSLISLGEGGILEKDPAIDRPQAKSLPFGYDVLAGALLAVDPGSREHLRRVIAKWKDGVDGLPASKAFRLWLERAEELLGRSAHELINVQADDHADRDVWLLAMVLLMLEEGLDPELRFGVHCVLVGIFSAGLWKDAVASHFARHVVNAWEKHACMPATLRAPRVSAPLILAATRDESEGWIKAARILLAASLAVVSKPPSGLRERLVVLAKGPEIHEGGPDDAPPPPNSGPASLS